jgi:hypothetical protein
MPSTTFTNAQLEILETSLDEYRRASTEQKAEISRDVCKTLTKQERKNGNKLSDGKVDELQKVYLYHYSQY